MNIRTPPDPAARPTRLTRGSLAALAFAALAASTSVCASPAAAQQATTTIPRTPEGRPDLSGNWTNATLTPFQRRRGDPAVLSPEVVAQRESGRQASIERGAAPTDPNRPPPEAGRNVGSYNNVWINQGDRIAVVNGEARSSLITRPADGRIPGLTAEGRRRLDAYEAFNDRFGGADNPENRMLVERCILFRSHAGPPLLPSNRYSQNYRVVQTPDHVMIQAEMIDDARIIRIVADGEPWPVTPADIRPWMGVSWGRWAGDTLVVTTTNIHPEQNDPFMPPASAELTVTERFSRYDEDTIVYEFTVDDPTTYTEPWGGEVPLERFPDNLYEYACHEANYALEGILRGARYEERQAEGR